MNELFIALYLDEDVDVLVAELVRARGFDAVTTQESGQSGTRDPDQLAYAVSQRRVILTHNRDDFVRLAEVYASTGRDHFGIILAVRRSPYAIAQRVLQILEHVTADEIQNQMRYI